MGTLSIDFEIDFPDAAIGRQHRRLTLRPGAFERELAAARTFCRRTDVEAMRSRGLALGGSLSNAVVVDGGRVLSPGGLRWSDEMVRHKMLDAVGDLALAGLPIHGRYVGLRSGHRLTNRLLRALFAEPAAWRIAGEEVPAGRRARPVALPAHA
jgi:UDP-3-O-[3-hydroxymyristoyl] N-acetylglucosamine deacetylase